MAAVVNTADEHVPFDEEIRAGVVVERVSPQRAASAGDENVGDAQCKRLSGDDGESNPELAGSHGVSGDAARSRRDPRTRSTIHTIAPPASTGSKASIGAR